MGKVRPSYVKHISREIVKQYENQLTIDFDENKRILVQIAEIKSKRFRNRVAGYVTRLMRIRHEAGLEEA